VVAPTSTSARYLGGTALAIASTCFTVSGTTGTFSISGSSICWHGELASFLSATATLKIAAR
jgi:hypothetical protein